MKGVIEVVRTPSPGFYSRLFLVPKARGTWRPIIDLSVLNTHIQCPSFKMETNGSLLKALQKGQWLTILDLKDAYFHIPIHPSYRQYLRFCHEGVVWQFRALPFGLNTAPRVFTMVTAPVVAYAHLNGVSLHVYLDDWLLNPISEESAKQQTQWLLDLCARLGWVVNVEKSSLTPSQVAIYLGISLDTRVGLAYPSERRIERWLSISEDFLPACPALVTTFGAPSFHREASSLRPVAYPTHSVPTSLRMVSSQRSSSDPGQPGSRDPGFHSLVETSFESPQRNPTRIPSGRSLPLHRLKCCGLGCSHGQKDRLREVVRGHERAAHQCAGTECDLAWSPSLRGYSPRLQCCHYVRQCLCHCLSEKSGGHSVSTDVPHGHRYLRMGRRTVHDTDTQTSPWASQCVSRSSEPQRSDSENRMESESSRSTACIPSLGQSTCGSVCTQVQHQTSNLHVSDSRTGGLEGRQSSPIMGRSVRLRIPTNGSDQTDSEQVNLAQSGADPHSPPLAETGMVSGPPTTVHSFPVGTSTNSKVAEAIILSSLSSEASDSKPSRVEVICRSNQARGFSEQVSNRIAVPQRKSTLDLYEQKWNTFREWCELNGINPHTPTVPMIAEFLLHLFRDKQLATITVKGYRSALSSLMASRGLDISHDPDLNALIRSFSIERPRTVRETPRWDLSLVLRLLMRHPFEPMNVCSLADLTRKTAFLLTLASPKRNSEVWAFSADVVFGHNKQSATLRFLPGFIAKTQKPDRPDTALSPVTIPALAPLSLVAKRT